MLQAEPLAEAPVVYRWRWALAASPEALWPLISDTNRMNMLAGMAPVRFDEDPDPDGGATRTGHGTMLGMGVRWDEHPFEWAYPLGFSVRRDFRNGVLRAYRSSVTLAARPEGGTELAHVVELVPRLGLMAPFVRLEGAKLEKRWGHAYRQVDRYLADEGPWPFAGPGAAGVDEAARAAEELAIDPKLAARLFDHVLGEAPHELVHVRPFMLADRWRLDREAVLAACFGLARRALLRPQWSLLCPHCRGAKGTADTLGGLADGVHCQSCNIAVGKAADAVVELSFRPDPRYRQVGDATYCVGGPGSTPHICFQAKLQPGRTREVGLSVGGGGYRLRGARLRGHFDFQYHPAPDPEAPEEAPAAPGLAIRGAGLDVTAGDPRHLEGAKLRLALTNESDQAQDVVIETRSWREDVVTLAWLRAHPALLARAEEG